MTTVLNVSLNDLSSQFINELKQKFGKTAEIEIRLQDQSPDATKYHPHEMKMAFPALSVKKVKLSFLALPIFLISTFLNYSAICQTTITSDITSNTTWTSANSPYLIGGVISVNQGINLSIEAGTVIKFADFGAIGVNGTISAIGAESSPIVFTSIKDDEIGGDSNNDGDATSPNAGDWLGVSFYQTSGNGSSLQYCTFKFGGSLLEIGAVDIQQSNPAITNCIFSFCAAAISVNTSAAFELSSLSMLGNRSGIIGNVLGGLTVRNCILLSEIYDLANFSPTDVDAAQNWWGIENYLLMAPNNPAVNIPKIIDKADNPSLGRVLYYPTLSPPLTIESITPSSTIIVEDTTPVLIRGYIFKNDAEIFLKKGELFIEPNSITRIDSFTINATFLWQDAETGIYDVIVVNPGFDTLRLIAGFRLLDIETIPFDEWVPFEVANGLSFSSAVEIPDIDNLCVFVKKSNRIGYNATWPGSLSVSSAFNDLSVEEDSDFIFQGEFSDIEFQKESPTAGTLFFEVKTLIAPGTGYILFTEAPEFLPLGEWQLGEILRPLGSDWKLIEVPDNSSSTPLS